MSDEILSSGDQPLTIFGEHAGDTVSQMWRCLGVGSAVKGVICADGHLGYAQPVGGDLDESPMAYRRLSEVLAAHGDTIRVQHVLKPRLVLMAGRGDRDPYKD